MFDVATELWSVVRNEPTDIPIKMFLSFARDNKYYVVGGQGITSSDYWTEVKYFDTDTNNWVHVTNLLVPTGNTAGFFYNA